MSALRLSCALTLAAALAVGQASAQPPASHSPFKVIEIAGDGSLPVFDNAVVAFAQRIAPGKTLPEANRFSASPAAFAKAQAQPATASRILDAIAGMKPGPGQGCLVFATSHGVKHAGLYLSLRDEVLTPRALDRALVEGCGSAPTAIIVSSCFSGSFDRPPMTRANRVILTAARPDRTSFGCQAGRVYTVYDQCLLDAMDHERGWRDAYGSIRACVQAEERREDVMASEPQAWFGAAADAVAWPVAASGQSALPGPGVRTGPSRP